MKKYILFALFIVSSFSINGQFDSPIKSAVYLVGDTGAPQLDGKDPLLSCLKHNLDQATAVKKAVIFLGDNIYHDGMHEKHHHERETDEAKVNAQLDAVKDFGGKVMFIPGNHDWNQGSPEGLKFLKRQEKYIESILGKEGFVPDNGCPGPALVKLGKKIAIVIIDTQWWLQKYDRPVGDKGGCDVKSDQEFIQAIETMLHEQKKKGRQIIVAGHHPLYTNGEHGGYFRLKDHLFPLTKIAKKLFIPLPVLGSIYPLYRKYVGNIQDATHERYQGLIKLLEPIFEQHPNLIYSSGHEHNLQFVTKNGFHHIVSGAGSKKTHLRMNDEIEFGAIENGFARVLELENREIWVEYFGVSEESSKGKLLFSKKLNELKEKFKIDTTSFENFNPDNRLQTVVAHEKYKAGPIKKMVMGKLYRETWAGTVEVPYLNLDTIGGGLIALQKGGGMQSRSLRFKGEDGHQYVTRSLNKYPEKLIPLALRSTVIADILGDGIAASNPYAFLTVPPLADAAGVYHTNPRLALIPDHPRLGAFQEEFKDMLVLFEERISHNQEDRANFGNSKRIYSSFDMIEHVKETHDALVDPEAMLRARLLDALIADWDRHEDQWRWASFKKNSKTVYKPVPRDRDQVYFRLDGILPYIASRPFGQRRFQSFKNDIRDIEGQMLNAIFMDRAFLPPLSKADWTRISVDIKNNVTDEIIEEAIARLPKSAYEKEGSYLIKTLKARRDKLEQFASRYYRVLAKEVEVLGSYDKEYFKIDYNDNQVRIHSYDRKNGKSVADDKLYDRVFYSKETVEVHIYGIGDNDEYHITGDPSNCKVKVRIIGGASKDRYKIETSGNRYLGKLEIYEFGKNDLDEAKFKSFAGAKLHHVNHESEHPVYVRDEFKYASFTPIVYPGYNEDDGVYIGGGLAWKTHSFKKLPFATKQSLKANIAITGAYNFEYKATFTEALGKFDLVAEVLANAPNPNYGFYGLRNKISQGLEYFDSYQMRIDQYKLRLLAQKKSDFDRIHLSIGPNFYRFDPERSLIQEERYPTWLTQSTMEARNYLGAEFGFSYENKDHRVHPKRGIHFLNALFYHNSMGNFIDLEKYQFAKLSSSLSLYFPVTFIPLNHSVAFRTAFSHNFGDSPFYFSNFIGGINEMRGFRRNRLAGNTSFYNNLDLRFKLLQFNNYLLPLELGLIGFFDFGRVWNTEEESKFWHKTYGIGLYVFPIDAFVLSAHYGFTSKEKATLNIKAGFHF